MFKNIKSIYKVIKKNKKNDDLNKIQQILHKIFIIKKNIFFIIS